MGAFARCDHGRSPIVSVTTIAVAVGALALAGCAGGAYQPLHPGRHAVVVPRGQWRVTELVVAGAVLVKVQADVHGVSQVRRAFLTAAASAPCTAGWREESVAVDGNEIWQRPVRVDGKRNLEFWFMDADQQLGGATVLDLEIAASPGRSRCVRLDLVSPGDGEEWRTGRFWMDVRLKSFFPVRMVEGAHDGQGLAMRIGRWFGPVNIGMSGEFAFGRCAGACLDRGYYGLVGAGPSVQASLYEAGRFRIGIEAAWDFLLAQAQVAGLENSRRSLLMFGPRLGLGVYRVDRMRLAGAGSEQRARWGVELFVADRLVDKNGGLASALVPGLALSLGFPL